MYTIDLEKGNYYIKVTGEEYYHFEYNDGIGSYKLQTSFKASGANMAEPNNSFSQVKAVTMGKEVKGQIALNDGFDIYKVNVSNGSFKIIITSYMKYYTISIYDSMAKEVWYTYENEWNESIEKRVDVHYPKLEKGNYYIKITGGRRPWDSDSTGNYSFKISKTASSLTINKKLNLDVKQKKKLKTTVIPSGTGEKVTYSIDNKKVATVNSSGVVTGKKAGHTTLKATVGENITAECDVFVYPLATKVLSLSSTTERGLWGTKYRYIHLKCKKIKNADYYQIYYSKKKNGKYKELTTISSNSKKWISINKKGTYYIKVRTKIYSDGWYLYSDWTRPKQVKVK